MTTNTAENSTNPSTTIKTTSIGMHSGLPQHIVASGQTRSLAHLSFLLFPFLTVLVYKVVEDISNKHNISNQTCAF